MKLPSDVLHAHEEPVSKGKLKNILRSYAVKDKKMNIGDIVNIFVKHWHQKRNVWSIAKSELKFDATSRGLIVSGVKRKPGQAAKQDVRHAIEPALDLAIAIQEAMDSCDQSVKDALNYFNTYENCTELSRDRKHF